MAVSQDKKKNSIENTMKEAPKKRYRKWCGYERRLKLSRAYDKSP